MMGKIVTRNMQSKATAENKNAIVASCWTYFIRGNECLEWTIFNWLWTDPVVGPCKHGNEASSSKIGRKSFHPLSSYQFLKKRPDPWSLQLLVANSLDRPLSLH